MEKLNIVKQILKCFKKGILKSTLDHVHKSTHPALRVVFVKTGEGGGTEFLRGNGAERESLIASRI